MNEMTKIEKEFNELELNDKWNELFRNLSSEGNGKVEITYNNSKHNMNLKYNRYSNIFANDHSRIKLKDAKDTDYINGNLVECKLINKNYIVTQGPLPNTCEHFWQMVWEQNSKSILMLNRLFENRKLKCEMYFPNADEENENGDEDNLTLQFGKFRLSYLSETPYADYSIRIIECTNLEQKETREIYHFHFTNWPDFGEPDTTTSFLKYLKEFKKIDSETHGPPVVHCSAGVGRSGTFVLVDAMLQLYQTFGEKNPFSVIDLLGDLRTYRRGLVQTPTQLKFAYEAIVHGIKEHRNKERLYLSNDLESSSKSSLNHEDINLIEEGSLNVNSSSNDEKMDELNEIDDEVDDDDDEENDENDDDDDDDDDDESQNTINENGSKRSLRKAAAKARPDTAKPEVNNKKFKKSNAIRKRIKKLRQQQEQNKYLEKKDLDKVKSTTNGYIGENGDHSNSDSNVIQTDPNSLKLDLGSISSESDENNDVLIKNEDDLSESLSENEDDQNHFASTRNAPTVRVNEARKTLEQTEQFNKIAQSTNTKLNLNQDSLTSNEEIKETTNLSLSTAQTENSYSNTQYLPDKNKATYEPIFIKDTSENGNSNFETNIYQRKLTTGENNFPTSSNRTKTLSEREQRIAEQVRLMKQKQIVHENHQNNFRKISNNLKPLLIGGGIILGGLIINHLYKKIF